MDKSRPSQWSNQTSNEILERIHSISDNFVWAYNIKNAYVDEDDPWLGILAAAEFAIQYTANILKYHTLGQMIFSRDIIFPIKHEAHWHNQA